MAVPQLKSTIVYSTTACVIILLLIFVWSWKDSNLVLPEPVVHKSDPATSLDFTSQVPSHSLQCSTDSFNVGSWKHKPIFLEEDTVDGLVKAVNYHCPWNFPHKCYRRDTPGEFNRSRAIMDYTWEPEACSLIKVDVRKFTEHLATNPMLMVGDSITQLQFESLGCLLGQDLTGVKLDSNLTGGDTNLWAGQFVHPSRQNEQQAVSLAYLRSDYLVRLDDFKIMEPFDKEGYLIGKGSNFPWVHALDRFTYIMINTGPHWHADEQWGHNKSDEELITAYSKAMKVVFNYLKDHVKPHQRIWVRSTPYGHAKCSQYKAPSTVPHAPSKKEGEYQWDLLEKFDFIWKDWIDEENDNRFHFFNVSSLSNLRGDSHSSPDSDCLHFCIPSVVDDWNYLLFHSVAQQASTMLEQNNAL